MMPPGGSGAATSSSPSTTTISSNSNSTGTRSGACERCHRRKVRCDKTQPQCSPCARASATCRYVTSEHQLRRRNVQRLESRIRELQSENQSLNGQLRRQSVEVGTQQQRTSPPHREPSSSDVSPTGAANAATAEPTTAAYHATPSVSASVPAPAPASNPASYADGVDAGPAEGGEVADQVIHLSLIAGGGQHFVGSTSGLLLANLLQSRPRGQSALPDLSSWPQQPRFIPELVGGVGVGANHGARSGSSSPPSTLGAGLPPKTLARELIAAYCSHDHLCYPFISTAALSRSLDAVYEAAREGKAVDPCDAFFVDMTLAIGTAQVHKFNWNGVYDAETHYNRAMTRLADVLGRDHGIARVQALLLVCQYRMGTTSSNTTTSVWHLIGVAARTCLELGLHRASAYALPQGGSPAQSQNQNGEGAVVEEMEIKRRCFWSLVALDRVTSLAMGRPFAIQLDDIEVDLPYVDAAVSTTAPSAGVSLSSPVYGTPHWHLATSIFVHIVKYRLICGKILTALHRHNKAHIGSVAEVDYEAVRDDLSRELQTWHAETANLPLVSSSAAAAASTISSSASTASASSSYSSRVSSFRSEEWYRLLYHNGMLMLFRPSPCLNDATRNSLVLRRIFESSRESVNLYATLHRSRKMNYSWVTMHTVFMAGLSYIYALRNHLQALQTASAAASGVAHGGHEADGRATLQSTPTINQVVNDTRACSKVLVAVSERWDLARTCSELFDRLSDAVVADVVEATTNPAPHPPFSSSLTAHNVPAPDAGTATNVSQLSPNGSLGLPVTDPATATSFSGGDDMYGSGNGVTAAAAAHSFINMSVDSTLRDCYPDLQNLGYDQYHSDAIAQLSQDWFFGIGDSGNRYF